MDNEIVVLVNGKELKKFTSVSLVDSIDTLGGGFAFSVAREEFDPTIQPEDEVKIFVNTELYLTGRVNRIENTYDIQSHNIAISGFAKTFSLVRAEIYSNPTYATPIKFSDLCNRLFRDNNIEDIDVATGFAESNRISSIVDDDEEGTAGDLGESLFSYIDRYARKQGLILSSDKFGNLVIYDNQPQNTPIKLTNVKGSPKNRLIKSATHTIDYSRRYKDVYVLSQDEDEERIEGFDGDTDVATDGAKVIISENITDISGCDTQASWEVNKRRSDSVSYSCTVFGFSYDIPSIPAPILWQKNQLIQIIDDFAGINSQMLLRSVEFKFDEREGSRTNLTFVAPDSYTKGTDSTFSLSRYEQIFGD